MLKAKIVLISALVSCALVSGCKDDKKSSVAIEFMHSSVEQERQAVIAKLIERFEKENPGISVKQVLWKKMLTTPRSSPWRAVVLCLKSLKPAMTTRKLWTKSPSSTVKR